MVILKLVKYDCLYLQMSSTVTGNQCFKLLNRSSSLSCWMTPVNKINLFLSKQILSQLDLRCMQFKAKSDFLNDSQLCTAAERFPIDSYFTLCSYHWPSAQQNPGNVTCNVDRIHRDSWTLELKGSSRYCVPQTPASVDNIFTLQDGPPRTWEVK